MSFAPFSINLKLARGAAVAGLLLLGACVVEPVPGPPVVAGPPPAPAYYATPGYYYAYPPYYPRYYGPGPYYGPNIGVGIHIR